MKPPARWVVVTGVAVLSLIAVAGFAIAIWAAWLLHDMPDASDLADYHPPTATRAYAWDGTLIGEFSRERRIFVPYDNIPPRLAQAFMAAEDREFFRHGGLDYTGILRAGAKDIINIAQGRRLESGSTITQQVAKNILLTNDATVGRKLKEALIARQLERTLSKERILELYLNEIWLGYRSYGVGAAAYNYFGKSISDLDLAECAYLASLPKGPDNYSPIRHRGAAIGRRNWVLDQMVDSGWATRAEAEAAKKEDLKVQPEPTRSKYRDADYFVEEVRRRGLATMGERLNEGGYYMRTTLDARLQSAARTALMDGLERYDHRHGWRGAWGHVTTLTGWEDVAKKSARPAERRTWRAAVVTDVGGGVARIRTVEGQAGSLAAEDVSWARAGKGIGSGDLVWVAPADTGPGFRLKQIPIVNGAMVAMDPQSGRVLAMVGGYSFSLSSFNRATQALRQPGSAFKPIVYATALESGYTPASVVLDAPISLPGANGTVWSPENYEHDYFGPLQLRRGLELSRNTMTVRIAQGVGMTKIAAMAERLGESDHIEKVLAMALGAGETTVFRLTGAYASFVNGGRKIEPHLIETVQDREGKTIFRADGRDCPRCNAGFNGDESPRIPDAGAQVMDPITAYQITSMLEGVIQRGTATSASVIGRPVGGKTGTTNEFRSAWFVGFSPKLVVGTFVGFDDNRSLGEGETGAVAAVPIFTEFMQEALKGYPPDDFPAPKNAKYAMVRGIREAFRPGTEPKVAVAPEGVNPIGPIPYNQLPLLPQATPPATVPAPKAKKPDETTGLY
ncbi:MAG: penicillin-binding protein 1A [Phenylobacterium sp.]|nr:MAG: penicillin-binding protein 1A [Phenylobacterium sp.]